MHKRQVEKDSPKPVPGRIVQSYANTHNDERGIPDDAERPDGISTAENAQSNLGLRNPRTSHIPFRVVFRRSSVREYPPTLFLSVPVFVISTFGSKRNAQSNLQLRNSRTSHIRYGSSSAVPAFQISPHSLPLRSCFRDFHIWIEANAPSNQERRTSRTSHEPHSVPGRLPAVLAHQITSLSIVSLFRSVRFPSRHSALIVS
jgi:hypothetical protein